MCKRKILLLTVSFQIQQLHHDIQNLLWSISSYKTAHKNDGIKKTATVSPTVAAACLARINPLQYKHLLT